MWTGSRILYIFLILICGSVGRAKLESPGTQFPPHSVMERCLEGILGVHGVRKAVLSIFRDFAVLGGLGSYTLGKIARTSGHLR